MSHVSVATAGAHIRDHRTGRIANDADDGAGRRIDDLAGPGRCRRPGEYGDDKENRGPFHTHQTYT